MLRITFIKIPFLILALFVILYYFGKKCKIILKPVTTRSFDSYLKRTDSSTQRKIIHSLTIIIIIIGFTIRLFLIVVESFTEFPKYNREWMDMIENDVFGFTFHRLLNKQMSINIDKDLNYKSNFSM